MIWNSLTKQINLIYQSAKSVKNSIFSNLFLTSCFPASCLLIWYIDRLNRPIILFLIFFWNLYDVIITDDVIGDVIMVGEQKVNMIWNPLTKPINLMYQLAKSVKNSIFSNFFLILMTSYDVINDVFLQTYRFFPNVLIYNFNNYYLRRQF